MRTSLTIAGSDSSGGAGIQADLKTFQAHGVFGMSAVTAVTVQNTRGVFGIQEMTPEIVGGQIDCLFEDIAIHAVKIGMDGNVVKQAIDLSADDFRRHFLDAEDPAGVLDRDGRHGAHAEDTVGLEGLEIRLDAGAARRIRPGDGQSRTHGIPPRCRYHGDPVCIGRDASAFKAQCREVGEGDW